MQIDNPGQQDFIYGSHYSTPAYVSEYLVRKNPEIMLKLYQGIFDKTDWLFFSIKKDWHNCVNNSSVFKELIPEFYEDDESFLVNKMGIDMGVR